MNDLKFGLDRESHRKIAVSLFNHTWELMEKERTPHEDELMISESQASLFHWRFAGGNLELARGHWIISRVYSMLSMPESAIYHGKKSLDLCRENDLGDFDSGFACEALARSYFLQKDHVEFLKYLEMANGHAKKIKDPEDRKWLEFNLGNIENSQPE